MVGNLFHLSNYALVAKNIETTDNTNQVDNSQTATTQNPEKTTNNPVTGDNIMMFVTMFIMSAISFTVVVKSKK